MKKSRTDSLQETHGLSLDDAVKVLVYHQQGSESIKGLQHDKLQTSMDEFTELLLKTPRDKVQAFTTYVREKYWAKPEEDIDKTEFERRWIRGQTILNSKRLRKSDRNVRGVISMQGWTDLPHTGSKSSSKSRSKQPVKTLSNPCVPV